MQKTKRMKRSKKKIVVAITLCVVIVSVVILLPLSVSKMAKPLNNISSSSKENSAELVDMEKFSKVLETGYGYEKKLDKRFQLIEVISDWYAIYCCADEFEMQENKADLNCINLYSSKGFTYLYRKADSLTLSKIKIFKNSDQYIILGLSNSRQLWKVSINKDGETEFEKIMENLEIELAEEEKSNLELLCVTQDSSIVFNKKANTLEKLTETYKKSCIKLPENTEFDFSSIEQNIFLSSEGDLYMWYNDKIALLDEGVDVAGVVGYDIIVSYKNGKCCRYEFTDTGIEVKPWESYIKSLEVEIQDTCQGPRQILNITYYYQRYDSDGMTYITDVGKFFVPENWNEIPQDLL